jgi:hypothetical protein
VAGPPGRGERCCGASRKFVRSAPPQLTPPCIPAHAKLTTAVSALFLVVGFGGGFGAGWGAAKSNEKGPPVTAVTLAGGVRHASAPGAWGSNMQK